MIGAAGRQLILLQIVNIAAGRQLILLQIGNGATGHLFLLAEIVEITVPTQHDRTIYGL